MYKTILTVIFLLASLGCQAEVITCSNMDIQSVAAEGTRDDNFVAQSSLLIKLSANCAGKNYVFASLDDPAFNAFLSVALAAKSTEKKVEIAINTSKAISFANYIAYIAFSG